MLALMADKQDTRDARKGPLSARVDQWIIDVLDRLAGDIRPRPSRSEMVAMVLEDALKKHRPKDKGR